MSTHFRPRPPTPGAPSPTRPSTARSTIRAISPSPPLSLKDAVELEFAHTGTPKESRDESEGAAVRPKSDGSMLSPVHRVSGAETHQEEPLAQYFVYAENQSTPNLLANTVDTVLKRGGAISGRSSPMKPNSRSGSPRRRQPITPAPLPPHHEHRKVNQTNGNDADNENTSESDLPDTPTPMTHSEKRSAYMPLGSPIPYALHAQSREPENTRIRSKPSSTMLDTNHAHGPGPTVSTNPGFDFQFAPQPPAANTAARRTPQASSTNLAPPAHAHLRKPVPVNNAARHVSTSGQTNISSVSGASQRSIFSTPGRDEMERKKPLVEVDEGPFARVTSLNELNERRRVISDGSMVGRPHRVESKEGKGRRICGNEMGCCVM